ncbi:MAG: GNAT family N-acetyltransferase, partial [Actinobacteria bacterium]|nr:GNAT family N-acetyltransferase [Actinomycetota bacterium]
MALVGRPNDKLHSHVTGVVEGAANSGVGRALKQNQWAWAKRNGFSVISWTFDPLVRRNAHFNLVTLGAKVVGYYRDFYGELDDLFNSGDSTDRLIVERQVAGCDVAPT